MIEVGVGLLVVLGVIGTIVPLLPGPVLIAATILAYAWYQGDQRLWVATGVALAILAIGVVAKWLVPARTVSGDVDRLPLVIGGVLALVGFFVIPVVGLLVGFVVGVFGTELVRTRSAQRAWPATRQAVLAAGLSMLIELTSVVLAAGLWLGAMVLT